MPEHVTGVDHLDDPEGDIAFAAFCYCGWPTVPTWHHADAEVGYPAPSAYDQAYARAERDGDEHLAQVADEADPPPDLRRFQALRIPTLDQAGYAHSDAAL
ncbi:MAG TPA: hypothetical protein VF062_22360 [Candidatus Limnocylindrales bacterium]